jgi:hypothetical protein
MVFTDEEREAVAHLLEKLGLRTPDDAIRKLDLTKEYATLREFNVPEKEAQHVLLVAYGKAVKDGLTVAVKGLGKLFGVGADKPANPGGGSFP